MTTVRVYASFGARPCGDPPRTLYSMIDVYPGGVVVARGLRTTVFDSVADFERAHCMQPGMIEQTPYDDVERDSTPCTVCRCEVAGAPFDISRSAMKAWADRLTGFSDHASKHDPTCQWVANVRRELERLRKEAAALAPPEAPVLDESVESEVDVPILSPIDVSTDASPPDDVPNDSGSVGGD